MNNFFCTGDVHGFADAGKLKSFVERYGSLVLTREDYLIVCGDFGVTWNRELREELLGEVYDSFPCTVLFVDGNHENFDILDGYPVDVWNGGKVHIISSNVIHLMRGQVFNINGYKIFAFGGAKSTDRGPDFGNTDFWWSREIPSKEERKEGLLNLAKNGNAVDLIVTHDAPRSMLDMMGIKDRPYDNSLSNYLYEISRTVRYDQWVFGHHHTDVSLGRHYCLFNTVMQTGAANKIILNRLSVF